MNAPQVELLYDRDCPNVEAARAQLRRALTRAGLPPRWREWDRAAPDSPAYVRQYGSPTILVNGCDVTGALPASENARCRLYRDAAGRVLAAPDERTIVTALRAGPSDTATPPPLPALEPTVS